MRRRNLAVLLPLLFLSLPFAKAKNKEKTPLPKLVAHAQYVMVTTYFGDPVREPLNPHITTEDRQAVTDVQNALEKWGRYTIAYRPEDAELILVVRKGRLLDATGGVRVQAGSKRPCTPGNSPAPCTIQQDPAVGPIAAVDAGDPQDELALYDSSLGTDNAPLWRGRRAAGLDAPKMQLVEELRTKVEETAKAP